MDSVKPKIPALHWLFDCFIVQNTFEQIMPTSCHIVLCTHQAQRWKWNHHLLKFLLPIYTIHLINHKLFLLLQGWEEVCEAGVNYLLSTSLAKSVRDHQRTTVDVFKDTPRFKKHLTVALDRVMAGTTSSVNEEPRGTLFFTSIVLLGR